ncbi:MAG: hypothetical protein ACJ75H_23625 [Thermoanaerobaculia bacterium]
MSARKSLAELLADLDERIAHHDQQEAFHGEREVFHHDQRSAHAAELEKLRRHAEALRGATQAVAELEGLAPIRTPPPPAPAAVELYGPQGRFYLARAVEAVVARKTLGEPFGVAAITTDVNRQYGDQLGGRVDERQISVSLRWLARQGRITRVQKGKGRRGAGYSRAR